jgi:CubicO group peptidase (beta-lactamase class C family)
LETASSPPEWLVDILERERKVLGLPGLVAGFIDTGNKPQIASVGIAHVGSVTPLHATDALHLGSCTKALTALLIADAIGAGQLRFTTTLGALSPVWKKSPWADCTIDDVLRHKAGLPENATWWALAGSGKDITAQRRDVLNTKWLSSGKVSSVGKFAYSNVGYVVLGSVIDTVYGMPYEDVVQLRIARPNLLQSTGFGNPPSVSGHSKAQHGYLSTTLDNPPVMNSAGRLHMSMGDWLQTAILHTDSRSFLPQDVRKQLQFGSVDGGYAGGWIVTKRSWAAGPALTHAGSNTFWFAVMWIAPNTGRAFAAVANAAGAEVSNSLDRVIATMIRNSVPVRG